MLAFLISSPTEIERISNINKLKSDIEPIVDITAIYPKIVNVPFKNKLLNKAYERTGRQLKETELGLLLSHRYAWNKFLKEDTDNALFLESDSMILNSNILANNFHLVHENYDIFFWGSFDGRIKIFKKNQKILENNYITGIPVINSLYCTYGYSLNKTAAKYLLKQTSKVNYPVDFWKKRLFNCKLKIGGIYPEIISTNQIFTSNIQIKRYNFFSNYFIKKIIDFKNELISYI